MNDTFEWIQKTEIIEDQTRASNKKTLQNKFVILAFLLFGVIFLAVGVVIIKAFIDEWHSMSLIKTVYKIILIAPILILSIVFLTASYEFFLDMQLKVSLTKNGLIVKYPMCKARLLMWSEFYAVCLCVPEMTYNTDIWDYEVICFVMKGEKTNLSGRWKTGNPFHMKRLICISHTEELLYATEKWCPIPVTDVREFVSYLKYR